MTEADIRGHVLTVIAAFEDSQKAHPGKRDKALEDAARRSMVDLAANVLVNLNDIAESLKFVASQHSNSEALFRG